MEIRQGRRKVGAIVLLVILGTVAAVSQACGGSSGSAAATPTARPLPGVAANGTPNGSRGFRANGTPGAFGTPGEFGGPGAFGTPGAGFRGIIGGGDSGLADFLGISQDQLQSELSADGATMATVAQAHGKSRDDLKTFLTDQEKKNADQAVTNGQMTQGQEDSMMQNLSSRLDNMIDGKGFGGGFGSRGTPGPEPTQ